MYSYPTNRLTSPARRRSGSRHAPAGYFEGSRARKASAKRPNARKTVRALVEVGFRGATDTEKKMKLRTYIYAEPDYVGLLGRAVEAQRQTGRTTT